MKKTLSNIILSGLLLGLISSCSMVNNVNSSSGSIKMSVRFPQSNFSIKAIPDNTTVITVSLKGDGILSDKPLTFNLTRQDTTKIVTGIPQGNKDVKVIAMDNKNIALAEGNGSVNIIAGQLNRVEVELKALSVPNNNNSSGNTNGSGSTPATNPTPTISPTDCIVEVKREELPLSEAREKSITDSGCVISIVEPSPTPSPTISPTPTSTPSPTATPRSGGGGGGGGSSSGGGDNNGVSTPVNVDLVNIEPSAQPTYGAH